MLGKILFTAGLVAVLYLALRARLRAGHAAQSAPAPRGVGRSRPLDDMRVARIAAWSLIGLMLGGSALMLYLQWEDGYRVVTVRVVNTNTGRSVVYHARRAEVGERSFETIDGLTVTLAEIERLELGASP